jgi:hypothetical protein
VGHLEQLTHTYIGDSRPADPGSEHAIAGAVDAANGHQVIFLQQTKRPERAPSWKLWLRRDGEL